MAALIVAVLVAAVLIVRAVTGHGGAGDAGDAGSPPPSSARSASAGQRHAGNGDGSKTGARDTNAKGSPLSPDWRGDGKPVTLAFGGDVKEQTRTILEIPKKHLESMGSSLDNVLEVNVFMADIKTEKVAMNEAYGEFFKKNAPARRAVGVEFPDTATRLEIKVVAWIP